MTSHIWLYASLESVSDLCLRLLNGSNPLFAQPFLEKGTINSDVGGYKYYLLTYLGIIALYITAILKKLTLSLLLRAFFVWQNGISVN